MRILLNLKARKDCSYDQKYFHKLQGFIYSLLKDSEYSNLHDKKGYKFFCFSNIFPVGEVKTGDKRNLLISSPDTSFIQILTDKLNELKENRRCIHIGEFLFEIEDISLIKPKLGKNCRLISSTPIIIRIPERNYEKYGIQEKKKRYVYWRPTYAFEAFVKQLEDNLIKKYKEFYGENFEIERIFEMFRFIKSVVNHVIIEGREYKVIGSVWEFMFTHLDLNQRKILEFGIDCGFGERNSLGFGFMNLRR